jgi:hypothetical protein
MKKVLLTMSVLLGTAYTFAQVVVSGVSPASVQGNYEYGVQANCGAWPGETDDATWNVLSNLDFNVAGTFIQAEAVLVDDGTPGVNATYGNNLSEEGCFTLINNTDANPLNDLTGKIAVIRRNTCSFGTKVQMAQDAGAIGAIIVNREDAIIGMLGDALFPNVTIPAVSVSSISGQIIIDAILNGDQPVMFIGNKLGAFNADAGAIKGEFMISTFGGAHSALYDGFTPGIQVYNYGANDQDITVVATIDGPGTSADYTSTVGPVTVVSGDTLAIFDGNPDSFDPWNLGIGNYPAGNYTLTYEISLASGADDFPFDNVYSANFTVQDELITRATLDGSGMPVINSFPSNSTEDYESCMMFQDPNASALAVAGMYFAASADTSVTQFEGTEIFLNAYQWDDTWVDLNDPGFTFDPATNNGFQSLNLITFGEFYPASDDDVEDLLYGEFQTPFQLQDNVRYLFCLLTNDGPNISFGYDNALDYGANYSILAQPISPVFVDGSTYAAGWNGVSAPSIALNTFDPASLGLFESKTMTASAYPNPATNDISIAISGKGNGTIIVTDLSGKVVATRSADFNTGLTSMNISAFDAGMYIFNVTLENGESAQFNVVKK